MIKPRESKSIWVACKMLYGAIMLFHPMLKEGNVRFGAKKLFANLGADVEGFLKKIGPMLPKECDELFEKHPLTDEDTYPIVSIIYELAQMDLEELNEIEDYITNYRKNKK